MLRTLASLLLLCTLPAIAHPKTIALVAEKTSANGIIGHTYVFSEKNQILQLNLPEKEKITARLYRVAGQTLIPSPTPITLTALPDQSTSILIDFAQSKKPTQYTLVFQTPKKSRLNITALSTQHLSPLQKIATKTPIILINPPTGLTDSLRQLSIPSRVHNTPPPRGGMLIFFKKNKLQHPNVQAKRLIIVNPPGETEQEIWIQRQKNTWKIIVPFHYFTKKSLSSALGQTRLKKLLLNTPAPL